jgi:hypothetical protein
LQLGERGKTQDGWVLEKGIICFRFHWLAFSGEKEIGKMSEYFLWII